MTLDSPIAVAAGVKPPSRRPATARARARPADPFLVVGIGASAGGLEACTKLVTALPPHPGMAFVLVQHLDPTHESLMVELLASHTAVTVRQATSGMAIERDHLYVIQPGSYLSVSHGALRLSAPLARHGARLPFDFLLHSLAEEFGRFAACVVLSGTGSDGSLGVRALHAKDGLVIAQEPGEAGHDGMPRNAILTGVVDLVLATAAIPDALAAYQMRALGTGGRTSPVETAAPLAAIIGLLRANTAHDFTLYKPGTLQRRIERRMAMASIGAEDMARYLRVLRRDPTELASLSRDLLIHVTGFFRDPHVFDLLAAKIIPDLVASQAADQPVRIWIAGCSTGEETYSLAMLLREQLATAEKSNRLQVFASDVDPDAVASAREGRYGTVIEADVSPARLARFFVKDEQGYTVTPELRGAVVFAVQDVLADPPFSRLDLVSCRNLLIYLRPEAQSKVISLFHFALREGGILVLGTSETAGTIDGRFEVLAKPERIYRRIGRGARREIGFVAGAGGGFGDTARLPARQEPERPSPRPVALAELCRRLVMDSYAPAAVLINRRYECLYSLGPTDRYLRVAPGHPTHDLLAMMSPGLRTRLRAGVEQVQQENRRTVIAGGRINHDGAAWSFSIDLMPVRHDGEELLLVCFIDKPAREAVRPRRAMPGEAPRVAELELTLDATRLELQGAIRSLELSVEDQRTINEEALSVNEEYQSANEELLTSKEELQSLNEELTALNSQLQETLERQRTTSNDLQNVLYSTDVATLFLDTSLNIRFFTPATKSLFSIIPGDVGRPLADLRSLASDTALPGDSHAVLEGVAAIDREIETQDGVWFNRRILPYRTHDGGVEGVVITFTDITGPRQGARSLELAKLQAEQANAAKSRFLAAASHDLRQPLQALVLLQGLLAKAVEGEKPQRLLSRVGETLGSMAEMLNALLDINQIDAGVIQVDKVTFRIDDLLDRLSAEFGQLAQAQGLALRVVPCGAAIRSDPRLLEQMIRNLLSNALKYTSSGKILLGCRRHEGGLAIEVWDTGAGIPAADLKKIFEEYSQLDNPARERSRGLGLGLSIVQRLAHLLGHQVRVRSRLGRGSVFSIDIAGPADTVGLPPEGPRPARPDGDAAAGHVTGAILVIEDDPELRGLLEVLLEGEGHRAKVVADGVAALALLAQGAEPPDLILADYNLPSGMDGLQVIAQVRARLRRPVPVIILTGDISTGTLRDIARDGCVHVNKPARPGELAQIIQGLLQAARAPTRPDAAGPGPAAPAPRKRGRAAAVAKSSS